MEFDINKKAEKYIRSEMDSKNVKFLKYGLLLVSIIFCFLIFVNIITKSDHYQFTNWIYAFISFISLTLFILLRKGYNRLPAFILVLVTWGGMLVFIWNSKSIFNAANIANLVIVLFTALLLNRRFALIVAIVSLINYWFLLYFVITDHFKLVIPPAFNMARDYTALMGATIALVYIYERSMYNAVARISELLIQKEKDQLKINAYELNYQEIFESINDAIFIHDPKDGRILDVNLSAGLMFGYQKNEFTKLNIEDLSASDEGYTIELAIQKINESLTMGYNFFEWRSKRANGTVFWSVVHLKSSIINGEKRVLSVVRDNDQVKLAQISLRSSEERLRATLEYTPNVAIQWYNQKGEVVYWNSASEKLYGYNSNELIGKTLDKLLYNRDETDKFRDYLQEITKTKFTVGPYESNVTTKNGEKKNILSTNFLIPGEREEQLLVCMDIDITEQKKAEEKILTLNENLEKKVIERTAQLEKANKEIEAFAYSISHDLRAPLRHIDGFVKLLFSSISKPSELQENYYSKIIHSSSRMSGMIDDLLNYSRIGRKEMVISRINLEQLVKDIVFSFQLHLSNRSIEWVIEPLPDIKADKNLMKIVFENLLSNAVKYTSKKEKAMIQLGYIVTTDNYYEIYISDNGAGFNMDLYHKLFGVFQRLHTNDEFEGTGIGLANVKQIVNRHNGDIRAFSKEGEGTTFYLKFPK